MLLTKEQILAAPDIKTQDVEVPEWGGTIRVSAFSANVRSELMVRIDADKKRLGRDTTLPELKLAVCALAIIDENGKRLFSDDELAKLGEKSTAPLDRVYAAAEKLNAVSEETSKEIEKN